MMMIFGVDVDADVFDFLMQTVFLDADYHDVDDCI